MPILRDITSVKAIPNQTIAPISTPSLLKKFKSIEKGRGIYSDAVYFNAVFTLLCKFFVDDETVIKSNSKFSILKKYCSCTNLQMSRIYGAATGDPRLSINCTPSTVVREARKCAKIGEKLLVVTASFNDIKMDKAHSRLVILHRDTSYRMTVYDPMVPLEVSPGSIEKIIAKKLNIRYADIASGRQELGERTCVINSLKKAVEIMAGQKKLKIVKKYDFVAKKYIQ